MQERLTMGLLAQCQHGTVRLDCPAAWSTEVKKQYLYPCHAEGKAG